MRMLKWCCVLLQQGKKPFKGLPEDNSHQALWCAVGQNWWTLYFQACHNNEAEIQETLSPLGT